MRPIHFELLYIILDYLKFSLKLKFKYLSKALNSNNKKCSSLNAKETSDKVHGKKKSKYADADTPNIYTSSANEFSLFTQKIQYKTLLMITKLTSQEKLNTYQCYAFNAAQNGNIYYRWRNGS